MSKKTKWVLPEPIEGFPQAMHNNVIVDISHTVEVALNKEEVLESGLVIPVLGPDSQRAQERARNSIPQSGIVVSCGPDCTVVREGVRVALPLNEGAMKFFSYDEKPEDRKFIITTEDKIPAIF